MAFFARDVYTATGSQTDFTINFDYLDTDDVEVKQEGVVLVETTQYTFPNATTVRLTTGATAGDTVIITRQTSQNSKLVDFTSGTLTEEDLDQNADQMFYMAQEAIDAATAASEAVSGSGNVPSPTTTDVGKFLKATAVDTYLWDEIATGTEGNAIPLLSGNNTHSGTNKFTDVVTLEDSGASGDGAPDLQLDRLSASPAASDVLGRILFRGKDSAANTDVYAQIQAVLEDPSSTAEDGYLSILALLAGSLTEAWRIKNGIWSPSATGGNQGSGSINAEALYTNGDRLAGWDYSNAVDISTGETGYNFATGLPSWITELEIIYKDLSTNTSNVEPLIQLGDSGGIETSGYRGNGNSFTGSAASGNTVTNGIPLTRISSIANGSTYTGMLRLIRWDPSEHLWLGFGMCPENPASGAHGHVVIGHKELSGTLTQLQLTTQTGVPTFDDGEIRCRYR